ncbi:M23 family metallopeptidase [Candidatus Poribacteria bacterium]|nr:M23 family metallopeptidase [Candidatus Poribacteria bacterium]
MRWRKFLIITPTLILIAALAVLFHPFYSDRQPPSIDVSLNSNSFSFKLNGHMRIVDLKAGVREITVRIENEKGFKQVVFIGKGRKREIDRDLGFNIQFVPEGRFKLIVEAKDASIWRNSASRELSFVIDHTPPDVTVSLKPKRPKQGGTLAVYVSVNERAISDYSVIDPNLFRRSSLQLYRIKIGKGGYQYEAILGLSAEARVGKSSLFISFVDPAGNRSYKKVDFEVRRTSFEIGVVNLPKGKLRLLTDHNLIEEDNLKLSKVEEMEGSREKLWSGKFIMPVYGPISSTFGKFRVYNNGLARSRHMGVDIAAKEGTPVKSANSGVVLFADRLNIRGNAVIIDHGLGVRSHYYHLRKILVKQGDRVKKGQTIGLVGSTGRASGPHLHWGMEVDGTFVDPIEWTRYEF